MHQLRPHLTLEAFLQRVRRQRRLAGYRVLFLEVDGKVKAVAGYRVTEFLAWGKVLYVDDLVTLEEDRFRGYGRELLVALSEEARRQGCDELHLDSGVQRFGAHRFYLRQRMDITSHHFAMKLQ